MLKTGTFNLRKFSTNCRSLHTKVDEEESAPGSNHVVSSDSTETFTQATLGGTQGLHDGEHKVLGVTWNVSSGKSKPKTWNPLTRMSLVVLDDILTHWDSSHVRYKIFMQARLSCEETIPESLMNQSVERVGGRLGGSSTYIDSLMLP